MNVCMKREELRENAWVTIRGKKIYWDALNCVLNRFDYWQSNMIDLEKTRRFRKMAYVLQVLAKQWYAGQKELDRDDLEQIKQYGFAEPNKRALPDVIEELFEQIGEKFGDADNLLEKFCKESDIQVTEIQMQQAQRAARMEKIAGLVENNHEDLPDECLEDIIFLYKLQKAKEKCADYKMNPRETIAAYLLIQLILQRGVSQYVTRGVLWSLVEEEFIDEYDLSELLQIKYHDKRDWEWYSEDIEHDLLESETIVEVSDAIALSKECLLDTIGIDGRELHFQK